MENHQDEPSLTQSVHINGAVASILSRGDTNKVYYFPGGAEGCHIFAKTDASSSSTCISYSVQSVEATLSGMNDDKTILKQGDHMQRGLNRQPPCSKWPPPMTLPLYRGTGCLSPSNTPSASDAPSQADDHKAGEVIRSPPSGSPLGPGMREKGCNGAAFWLREDGVVGVLKPAMKRAVGSAGHSVFAPYVGLQFDSEVEAYEFYNTYSWEMGFGIKRGRKYENTTFSCKNCIAHSRSRSGVSESVCKECKAMICLKRTFDHGWYISKLELEHKHMMADTMGEKMHWKCHNNVDPS
ncbi:hypothetical protein ACQ4PT_027111 [Festuca glaucescens]